MKDIKFQVFLERYSGKDIYLLLVDGNKGDGLIYMGTITLLKSFNINVTEIRYPTDVCGKTLFVLGSGGFCRSYHRMPEKINFYIDRFEELIICPSSFDLHCDIVRNLVKNLPEKVNVFCRERYSYKQVLNCILYKKNVFLDHDLALSFDYGVWKRPGKGRLNAFRLDRESMRGRYIPDNNYDVSLNKEGKWEPLQEERWKELLEDIAGYNEVHTDRAHVAIASAMLGKETYVYANNYHKLKGIYEYSLANFSNVKWRGNNLKTSLISTLLRFIKWFLK